MSDTFQDMINSANAPKKPRRRWSRIILWTLVSIAAIIVIFICAVTYYLTGDRLAKIISREASEYFNADVRIGKVEFTLWSTWPHLCLQVDSVTVVSRSLHAPGVSKAQLAGLPKGSDTLMTLRHLDGSVNFLKLFAKNVEMGDVEVDGARLNLVALNDSVNNFSILPERDKHTRLPYISARSIRFVNSHPVTYFSAPDSLNASARLTTASLRRRGSDRDHYVLDIGGKIDAGFSQMQLFRQLPFGLKGDVDIHFEPLAISLSDMDLRLANLSTRTSLKLDLGEQPALNSFSASISPFELMKLFEYLPARFLPDLKGLESNLSAQVAIELTKPYSFASAELPSFRADFAIPASSLDYRMADGRKYHIRNIALNGALNFDGSDWRHSSCSVSDLSANADGLRLRLSGIISNLWDNPVIRADYQVKADMAKVLPLAHVISRWGLSGQADFEGNFSFPLLALNSRSFPKIHANGSAHLDNVSLTSPDRLKARIGSIDMLYRDNGSDLLADARLTNLTLADGEEYAMKVAKAHLTASAPLNLSRFNADLSATGLRLSCAENAVSSAFADSLRMQYAQNALTASAASATITFTDHTQLTGRDISARANLDNLSAWNLYAALLEVFRKDPDPKVGLLTAKGRDISVEINRPGLQGGHANILAKRIGVMSQTFPAGVILSDIDAGWFDNDSLALRRFHLRAEQSALDLQGSLVRTPRPGKRDLLKLRFDLDADTLHLNQLAHIWQSGSGHISKSKAIINRPTPTFFTPENVDLVVRAHADATVYTNLRLSDLDAVFVMNPRGMAIDTLSLMANFGQAALAVHYDCPDEQHLQLSGNMGFHNFDLQKFFQSYPKVLAMMPEMINLHGIFDASASFSSEVFPSMQLNTPSMLAFIDVDGRNLYVHQTPFITHLAHMVLIREKGDIYIPDIRLDARVYDNLLTLYPFSIHLPKYDLQLMGRNDFQGHLDYHVRVNHNPIIPFKFGVNIGGMFHHPHLSFGRPSWNEKKALLTNDIDRNFHINVIRELRKLGLKLLHHAASADK